VHLARRLPSYALPQRSVAASDLEWGARAVVTAVALLAAGVFDHGAHGRARHVKQRLIVLRQAQPPGAPVLGG